MPKTYGKTFWSAYLELSWHDKFQEWLDDTMAVCNECGCQSQIPQVDLIWTRPNGTIVAGTFCYACHDLYANLTRNPVSEEYWTRLSIREGLKRGGFNG